MRKFLFMAAIAALVLSSCSEDKEIGKIEERGSEIAFRTFIDKGVNPRATVTDGTNILGFTVTAWWDKKATPGSPAIGSSNPDEGGYLFNAYDITRREAGIADWNYDPKLYWPTKGSGVYFYAYSPASSKNVTKTKGLYNYEGNVLEYTVPDPSRNEAQEDFLLAKTDALDGKTTSVVHLNFAHALSRATFSAKKTSDLTYLIKSVEMMDLHKTGEIEFKNIPTSASFTYNGSTVYWDPKGTKGSISVDLGESPVYVQKDEYHSILGPTNALMVLPQITTDGDPSTQAGFLVKVLYKAYVDVDDPGTYYAGKPGKEDDKYKTVYFKVPGHVFEIGRQYNFALTFGTDAGGEIKFDVSVGDWSDAIQSDLPEVTNYWNAGLISHQLAIKANADYLNTGVTMAQMLIVTELSLNTPQTSYLKGLEYFRNLNKLTIEGTSGSIDLDLSGLPITTLYLKNDAKLSTLNLSNNKKQMTIDIPLKGTNDNKIKIDNLILWDDWTPTIEDDKAYKVKTNTHGDGSKFGYIQVNQINGDDTKAIPDTRFNQFWK